MDILSHDQFEELSALAAAGEIGYEDWQALKAHLEDCASCRGIFADIGQIQSEWLPEHPDFEIARERNTDLRLRKAILTRVSKSGARFSKAALTQRAAAKVGLVSPKRTWVWSWAVATASLVVLAAGFVLQRSWHRPPRLNQAATTQVTARDRSLPAAGTKPEDDSTQVAEAKLQRALRLAESDQAHLRAELQDAQKRTDALGQQVSDGNRLVTDLRQQLQAAHDSEASSQAELVKLRFERSTSEAVTILQEREIQTLNQKLQDASSRVDRERDLLSAGREIRDLIAARSLHIIDVYDTDSQGKTSRAFGRVFYTEGKSLVFYAYDLSDQHPLNTKYAFYVWGKRDGVPQIAKNLGAMAKDDASQKRWVLTITDPNVLAEVDSVFVTLEPVGQAAGRPSGKRLLTAFLGTAANHP